MPRGALKLKEISYIPTDAYSAGEMKHGPIALLDPETPVVCLATGSHVYDKVVSNIQEVRARGAEVVAIATDGNEDIQHHADDVIYIPRTHPFLQAALAVGTAAAPRLPNCTAARAERRSAAQLGQDRHCRVERGSAAILAAAQSSRRAHEPCRARGRKAVLPLVLILVPLASAACSSGEAGTTVVAATSTAEGTRSLLQRSPGLPARRA